MCLLLYLEIIICQYFIYADLEKDDMRKIIIKRKKITIYMYAHFLPYAKKKNYEPLALN